MLTVYSGPYLINPLADDTLDSEPEALKFSDTNFDLFDKIKRAISKIKSLKQIPVRKKYAKFPCALCERNVSTEGIQCSNCSYWVHRKCNGTTKQEYEKLSEEPDDVPFHCLLCTIQLNAEIFPFTYFDKAALNELNGIDLPSQLNSLVPQETRSKLTNLPNLSEFDLDENLAQIINSKYYEIKDVSKLSIGNSSFSFLHANLRSLSAHIDDLKLLLDSIKLPFDILGISETKEQVNKDFLSNINLAGYDFYSQPSISAAGGVALYINSKLNYLIREELNATENEFECIWIEVKNSKSQNIPCCCIYRHPNTQL